MAGIGKGGKGVGGKGKIGTKRHKRIHNNA
jgi:hypothetical protein